MNNYYLLPINNSRKQHNLKCWTHLPPGLLFVIQIVEITVGEVM